MPKVHVEYTRKSSVWDSISARTPRRNRVSDTRFLRGVRVEIESQTLDLLKVKSSLWDSIFTHSEPLASWSCPCFLSLLRAENLTMPSCLCFWVADQPVVFCFWSLLGCVVSCQMFILCFWVAHQAERFWSLLGCVVIGHVKCLFWTCKADQPTVFCFWSLLGVQRISDQPTVFILNVQSL